MKEEVMARKRQKPEITQKQLKKMFAKFKIREFCINLPRLTILSMYILIYESQKVIFFIVVFIAMINNIVSQIIDNDEFRKALFEKYGIRDCSVRLNRLDEKDIPKKRPKLLAIGDVRSNSTISWFPSTTEIQKKSVDALSSLVAYQIENGIASRVAGKS